MVLYNEKIKHLSCSDLRVFLKRLVKDKIEKELSDSPPMLMNKGNVIKQGVSAELDDLRSIQNSAQEYLDRMLEREIKRTGIASLKISDDMSVVNL